MGLILWLQPSYNVITTSHATTLATTDYLT
jgi:hypothetical protein